MTKIRLLPLLAAITCATQAQALGLGTPQVESYLGEPLRISAPLYLDAQERAQLPLGSVSVAKAEVFQRFRVPYRQIHSQLDLQVELIGNQATLMMTTPFSFTEPYLEVPLDIKVGDNHLLKVVTLLIDPRPAHQGTAQVIPSPEAGQNRAVDRRNAEPQPTTSRSEPTENRSTRRPTGILQPQVMDGHYGPVAVNQTLSDIARQVGPQGATIYQSLVALWEANPDAFLYGNMNYLKAGSTLRIPSREEVLSRPAAAARQEVVAQYAASKGRQRPLRQAERPAPTAAADQSSPATSSAESTKTGEQTMSAGSEQQLEIVTPPSAEDVPAEFREDFTALTSQLTALNAENNELRQRVTDLEQRIATMTDLMLAEAPLPAVPALPPALPPAEVVAVNEPSIADTAATQVNSPVEVAEVTESSSRTEIETSLATTTGSGDTSRLLSYSLFSALGLGLILFAGLWITRSRQRAKYRQLLQDTSAEHLF